ncbi:MAG: AraC family transcriptional regulator [Clostridia bacterium]|nr:AraC family transcriptional regulator [Clostridia bacterium]
MKVVSFDKLYHTDYNLKNIFSMCQYWKDKDVFRHINPRPTSAFLYLKNCGVEYTMDNGKVVRGEEGDVIYIPKGSVYSSVFYKEAKDGVSDYLIEFNAFDEDGECFAISDHIMVIENISGKEADCFFEAADIFKSANPCIAEAKAVIYKLISSLSYEHKIRDIHKSEFSSIAEGIVYMENDILQEKSIAEIADMCHVSPSHFRSLFKKYAGVSPISYQINAKIEHAKLLLQSGDMNVGEVSDYLGFSDKAYFCRIFKKYTGLSPKAYLVKEHI